MFPKSISPTPLSWGYQEMWNDAYGSHSISAGQPWPTLSENDVKRSGYHDTTATATRSNFSKVLMQAKFVKHYHIKNNLTLINPLRIFFFSIFNGKRKIIIRSLNEILIFQPTFTRCSRGVCYSHWNYFLPIICFHFFLFKLRINLILLPYVRKQLLET